MNNPVRHSPVSNKQAVRRPSAVVALSIATLCALAAFLVPVVSQSQVTRSAPKPIPPNEAYLQPVPGLSHGELRKFRAGEKQFKAPWSYFHCSVASGVWAQLSLRAHVSVATYRPGAGAPSMNPV